MTVEGTSEIASQAQAVNPPGENQQAEVKPDKVFYQTDLDKVATKVRHEAYEKGRRDLANELQLQQVAAASQQQTQMPQGNQFAAQQGQPALAQPNSYQAPVMQQNAYGQQPSPMQSQQTGQQANYMTIEDARRLFNEQAEMQRQQGVVNQVINDFGTKLIAGSQKYPDFEEKIAPLRQSFKDGQLGELIWLTNGADNTADIIYDLANNPQKVANLVTLAQKSPPLAHQAVAQLSNSIKMNENAAKQTQSASEPLTQVKPSTTGTDNGSLNLRDFKRLLKV